MKRIHLLKPGTFVGEDGKSYTFTAADIQSIARSYNPSLSEAPIVVGHPKSNSPAFGWISKVCAEGDNLYVEPRQVNPAFADAVAAHSYKKVSAKLYGPEHPQNPVKGEWYLQHVGFLGGQAPAVKGLQEVQFAASDEGCVTVSLSEGAADDAESLGQLLRRVLRIAAAPALSEETVAAVQAATAEPAFAEWTADKRQQLADGKMKGDFAGPGQSYPIAGADDVKNAWDLAGKAADADGVRKKIIHIAKRFGWTDALPDSAKKFAGDQSISLSEASMPTLQEQLDAANAENARLKTEAQAAATAARNAAQKARREGFATFAEGLVKAGKMLPAEKPLLIELASRIDPGLTVALSEGTDPVDVLDSFQKFLGALPVRVHLREAAPANGGGRSAAPAFAAPPGYTVQADRLELDQRAQEYMRAHPNTDYVTAVQAVENA